MNRHSFQFVPVGRQWGWSTSNSGMTSMWWSARLSKDGPPVYFSDGRDARGLQGDVILRVDAERARGEGAGDGIVGHIMATGDRWRYMVQSGEDALVAADRLEVTVEMSAVEFERILASARIALPPNLTVGFGPEHTVPRKALTGVITADSSQAYRWDNTADNVIDLVEWECGYSQSIAPPEPPEPDETPAFARALGTAFAAAMNLGAIALAAAAYGALDSRFQVIAISLLLLIYVAIATDGMVLSRALLVSEIAAISRYLDLRAVIGVTAGPAETQKLSKIYETAEQPPPKFWVNTVGMTILGLMATYKLVAVLW